MKLSEFLKRLETYRKYPCYKNDIICVLPYDIRYIRDCVVTDGRVYIFLDKKVSNISPMTLVGWLKKNIYQYDWDIKFVDECKCNCFGKFSFHTEWHNLFITIYK